MKKGVDLLVHGHLTSKVPIQLEAAGKQIYLYCSSAVSFIPDPSFVWFVAPAAGMRFVASDEMAFASSSAIFM